MATPATTRAAPAVPTTAPTSAAAGRRAPRGRSRGSKCGQARWRRRRPPSRNRRCRAPATAVDDVPGLRSRRPFPPGPGERPQVAGARGAVAVASLDRARGLWRRHATGVSRCSRATRSSFSCSFRGHPGPRAHARGRAARPARWRHPFVGGSGWARSASFAAHGRRQEMNSLTPAAGLTAELQWASFRVDLCMSPRDRPDETACGDRSAVRSTSHTAVRISQSE